MQRMGFCKPKHVPTWYEMSTEAREIALNETSLVVLEGALLHARATSGGAEENLQCPMLIRT